MPVSPNLVLIGFMATGKSTVGRRCAAALGFRFRDSDTLVERRAGKPVAAIFAEQGEAAFRAMEAQAIYDLSRGHRVVLATGGGAPMNPVNVANLRRNGVIVFLHAAPEAILQRAGSRQSRPLLADAENPTARIESLLAQREPVYRSVADAVVDTTGLTQEEVVERVLAAYRTHADRRMTG
jgi:shikimate kinase